MKSQTLLVLLTISSLTACQDGGPTAADITAAYEAAQAERRDHLLERYGSSENVPGVQWNFALLRYEVDLTECENAQDERGFLCVYDLHLFPKGGDVEMAEISPVKDVEARVFKVSDGWDYEELAPEEDPV